MEEKAIYEIATREQAHVVNFEEYAMTTAGVLKQVAIIQEVMKAVMQGPSEENKDGVHYGTIPGTKKPSLFKAGAEKLSLTFRLRPEYEIRRSDLPNGHREYEVVCTLYHIPTGQSVGQGVGSGTTMEGKYRFRKADLVCPGCEQSTIIKGKQEFGGGWLCYQKKGGCGKKWTDKDNPFDGVNTDRAEHDNPADYYNTVLKMAKKRAHVDAILTATAASDIFTQDVEDMPEVIPGAAAKKEDKPPLKEPAKKSTEPAAEVQTKATYIRGVESKEGEKNGKKYTIHGITDEDGILFKTFDLKLKELAQSASYNTVICKLHYTEGKFGNNLTAMEVEKTQDDVQCYIDEGGSVS